MHRVYKVFNSLSEFEVAATQLSVAELRRFLDAQATAAGLSHRPPLHPSGPPVTASPRRRRCTPSRGTSGLTRSWGAQRSWRPSTTGRLQAEVHPVLLFEAIGGTGKSMLTWEWANPSRQ